MNYSKGAGGGARGSEGGKGWRNTNICRAKLAEAISNCCELESNRALFGKVGSLYCIGVLNPVSGGALVFWCLSTRFLCGVLGILFDWVTGNILVGLHGISNVVWSGVMCLSGDVIVGVMGGVDCCLISFLSLFQSLLANIMRGVYKPIRSFIMIKITQYQEGKLQ